MTMKRTIMGYVLPGDDSDMLLAVFIGLSLLLHGVLVFMLPGIHNPKQLRFIELSLQEITQPDHQDLLGPPSEQNKDTVAPVMKPEARKEIRTEPLVKPKRKPEPLTENTNALNPESLPEQTKTLPMERAVQSAPAPEPEKAQEIVSPPFPVTPVDQVRRIQSAAPLSRSLSDMEDPIIQAATPLPDARTIDNYLASIRKEIERNKRYPIVARRRGQEGEVDLRFFLLANGNVEKLEVKKTSGIETLDRAAMDAVIRATPFAMPPKGFINGPKPLELTIIFKLG